MTTLGPKIIIDPYVSATVDTTNSSIEENTANNPYSNFLDRVRPLRTFIAGGFGPEIIIDGDFTAGVNDSVWYTLGATLSEESNRMRVTSTGAISSGRSYQLFPTVVGRDYRVTADLFSSGAEPQIFINTSNNYGGAIAGDTETGDRAVSLNFTATATTTFVICGNNSNITGSYADYDNVSVKVVPSVPQDNARIVLDIPAAVTLSGFFLDNVNFDSVQVNTYDVNFANPGNTETVSVSKDARTGRRKVFHNFALPIFFDAPSSSSTAKLEFRVASNANMFNNLTKGEFGAVTLIEDKKEPVFPVGHMNDIVVDVNYPQVVNKFLGGNIEPISVGERFIDIVFPTVDVLNNTQETAIMDILEKELVPIVFYENNVETQKVYTVRLDSAKSIRKTYRVSKEVFSIQLKFKEII